MPGAVRKRLVRKYRRTVHPALRASLRRARITRTEQQRALVSIIIPIYKVEEYLAECLTSVIEQSYRNLEIIVVDDGSPDGSYDIAKSYARWDPRIRIIRQQNQGLGAARNTGVEAAHGRYISFADSDDALPRDAIATMVHSLRSTGSDFAVGAPVRMANGETWRSGWVKDVHAVDRLHTTLDDFPDILKDVFAWNKLFEADFYRRVVGSFPAGIRYEDQEPTARAYVAGTFDVLAADIYFWRDREDGTSITQQKADPADLHDRLIVKEHVSKVISEGASKPTHDVWLAKAIGFDLRAYFEEVPRTDERFFEQLREGVIGLNSRMTPDIWRLVPIVDRIPALAVLSGNRDDVFTAVTRREEYGWFFPTEVRDGRLYLSRSYLEGMDLDPADELLEIGEVDIRATAKVTSLWWHGQTLAINGYAFLTNVAPDPEIFQSRFELVSADGVRVAVSAQARRDNVLAMEAKDAWNDRRSTGFSLEIDPSELPLGAQHPWHLEVTISGAGFSRTLTVRDYDSRGIAGAKPVAPAAGKVRWMASFEEKDCLTLRHTTALETPITAISPLRHGFSVTVQDSHARTLRLSSKSLRRSLDVRGKLNKKTGQVTFDVALPPLIGSDDTSVEHLWSARLLNDDGGGSRKLTYYGSMDDLHQDFAEYHAIRPSITRAGSLRVAQNRWWAVAEEVSVDDEALYVRGRISAAEGADLKGRMVSHSQTLHGDQAFLDHKSETFSIRFPFNTGGHVPTIRHGFSVRLSVWIDGRRQERWLKVADSLQHRFPDDQAALRYGVTLTRTKKAAALWVRFRSPYQPDERGRRAQRRLHVQFRTPTASGGGLEPEPRPEVLFESFNGRSVGDSVLAIHDELRAQNVGLRFRWAVADLNTPVPEGATPVLLHSRDYMDALHNARYLVNNNNFPFYFRKRPGQTYIQTWHGTPLKQIGDHVPSANLSLSYRQLMKREAGYWDVLLAQNDFAAEVLPEAFGYRGRVLNLGYPRNDALTGAAAADRRILVRRQLGLSDDQQVALYAPTWRDNVSVSTGYALVSHLDSDVARGALGEDSVLLLRGHANTAHDKAKAATGVLDVTSYPNINDLILASDVLITDYSSVMFDYCVTGKPILFLTPDLDEYRDVIRGFYLDLEDIAPGPICRDNAELAEALSELVPLKLAYAARYARFVDRFASNDDGAAAQRVTEVLFGSSMAAVSDADAVA